MCKYPNYSSQNYCFLIKRLCSKYWFKSVRRKWQARPKSPLLMQHITGLIVKLYSHLFHPDATAQLALVARTVQLMLMIVMECSARTRLCARMELTAMCVSVRTVIRANIVKSHRYLVNIHIVVCANIMTVRTVVCASNHRAHQNTSADVRLVSRNVLPPPGE